MVMIERYGVPSTKIISLIKSWQIPFRNVQKGDRFLLLTDDAMDPMNSKLRLEGIVARPTVIVDEKTVVCEKGKIKF